MPPTWADGASLRSCGRMARAALLPYLRTHRYTLPAVTAATRKADAANWATAVRAHEVR